MNNKIHIVNDIELTKDIINASLTILINDLKELKSNEKVKNLLVIKDYIKKV